MVTGGGLRRHLARSGARQKQRPVVRMSGKTMNCATAEFVDSMTLPPSHRALYTDYLSIYPFICLSVYLCCIYLFVYLFIQSSCMYLPIYLSISLSIHLSIELSICPSCKMKTEGHLPRHLARFDENSQCR